MPALFTASVARGRLPLLRFAPVTVSVRFALLALVVGVAISTLISVRAWAESRPDGSVVDRTDPKIARRAAQRYLSGVHGGKWRATFVDWNQAGKAQVHVRAKNPWRRLFGAKAVGTITVGRGGDILDHCIKPGCVLRAAQATGRGIQRLWSSPVVKDLRSSKSIITLAAAAGATYVANQFGMPRDQLRHDLSRRIRAELDL